LGQLTSQTSIALATYGVRYVVVRPHAPLDPWTVAPGTPGKGFAPILTGRSVDLYRVTATGYATVSFASGFYGTEIWQGLPRRWMQTLGTLDIRNPNSRSFTYRFSGVAFSAHVPRHITVRVRGRGGASFNVATSDGPWSFTLRLPAGSTQVQLAASPPAGVLGAGDSRLATIYFSDIESDPISSP
jgi:hypothetical protein